MDTPLFSQVPRTLTRRDAIKASAALGAVAAGGFFAPVFARAPAHARADARLKVGVIGCGGRGTGAMVNILEASPDTQIHALGDIFADRIAGCKAEIDALPADQKQRCVIDPENVFVGVDAYKKVLATACDIVILATPPGFRPQHFAAAIDAGKHVFFEKPVAVDPAGVRTVLAAARLASEKKLHVVTGTQRRHEACYLDAMERIRGGAIGDVLSASVFWNQGGLWMNERVPTWTDAEWQLRNWLYFAWLSGDHICEQHVHNLDAAHWAMDALPVKAYGQGGRQVRTSPAYGHVFDHFAVGYEYADGRHVTSFCRQIDGCSSRVEEVIYGSKGRAVLASGRAEIFGSSAWKWTGTQENPYVSEHKALLAAITGSGPSINEAERVAHSTLMAIIGRMSAYTGKTLTWEQAMTSPLSTFPEHFALGPMPAPAVAVPGKGV